MDDDNLDNRRRSILNRANMAEAEAARRRRFERAAANCVPAPTSSPRVAFQLPSNDKIKQTPSQQPPSYFSSQAHGKGKEKAANFQRENEEPANIWDAPYCSESSSSASDDETSMAPIDVEVSDVDDMADDVLHEGFESLFRCEKHVCPQNPRPVNASPSTDGSSQMFQLMDDGTVRAIPDSNPPPYRPPPPPPPSRPPPRRDSKKSGVSFQRPGQLPLEEPIEIKIAKGKEKEAIFTLESDLWQKVPTDRRSKSPEVDTGAEQDLEDYQQEFAECDTDFSAFFPLLLELCSALGILAWREPKMDEPSELLEPFDQARQNLKDILFRQMPNYLRRRVFLYQHEIVDGLVHVSRLPPSSLPEPEILKKRKRKYLKLKRKLGPSPLSNITNAATDTLEITETPVCEASPCSGKQRTGKSSNAKPSFRHITRTCPGEGLRRRSSDEEQCCSVSSASPCAQLDLESVEQRNRATLLNEKLGESSSCAHTAENTEARGTKGLGWEPMSTEQSLEQQEKAKIDTAHGYLVEMGFPRDLAMDALRAADGIVGSALEMLLAATSDIPEETGGNPQFLQGSKSNAGEEAENDPRKRAPSGLRPKKRDMDLENIRLPSLAEFGAAIPQIKPSGVRKQCYEIRSLHRFGPRLRSRQDRQHIVELTRAVDVLIAEIGRLWRAYKIISLCIGVDSIIPPSYDVSGLIERLGEFAEHARVGKVLCAFKARIDILWDNDWDEPHDRQEATCRLSRLPYTSKSNVRRAVLEAALSSLGIRGVADLGMLGV